MGRNPEWEELPFTDEEYIREYLGSKELNVKNFKAGLRLCIPYVTDGNKTPEEILKVAHETLMDIYKDCYVLVPRSWQPDGEHIPWRRFGRNSYTWCVPIKDLEKDKPRPFFHDAVICLSCFSTAETWGSTPHAPTHHF